MEVGGEPRHDIDLVRIPGVGRVHDTGVRLADLDEPDSRPHVEGRHETRAETVPPAQRLERLPRVPPRGHVRRVADGDAPHLWEAGGEVEVPRRVDLDRLPGGGDHDQLVGEQVLGGLGPDRAGGGDVVHPSLVGADENVCRSAGHDLPGEVRGGVEAEDDLDAPAGLEAPAGLAKDVGRARRREDGHPRRIGPALARRETENDRGQQGEYRGSHESLPG